MISRLASIGASIISLWKGHLGDGNLCVNCRSISDFILMRVRSIACLVHVTSVSLTVDMTRRSCSNYRYLLAISMLLASVICLIWYVVAFVPLWRSWTIGNATLRARVIRRRTWLSWKWIRVWGTTFKLPRFVFCSLFLLLVPAIHVLLIISCYDCRFAWSTLLLFLLLVVITWIRVCQVLANIEICPFWALWRFTHHLSFLTPDVTVTDTDTDADRTANSGAYDHDPRHNFSPSFIHFIMLLRLSSRLGLFLHVLQEEYSLVIAINCVVVVAAKLSTVFLDPLTFTLLTRFAKTELPISYCCKVLHLNFICLGYSLFGRLALIYQQRYRTKNHQHLDDLLFLSYH